MAVKTENDVLNEWVERGYISDDLIPEQTNRCLSFIRQAKANILAYCNIPECADMPSGLFYAWVDLSRDIATTSETAGETGGKAGSGTVKRVSEGNTTIEFDVGNTSSSSSGQAADISALVLGHAATLNRCRRMP